MAKLTITITIDEAWAESLPNDTAETLQAVAKVLDAGDAEYHPAIVTNGKGEQIAIVEHELTD